MKATKFIGILLLLLGSIFTTGCNPMQLNEEPTLAGDFSDPMYPKVYGRVSVDVNLDGLMSPENETKQLRGMSLEFYFVQPDGNLVLCKEYTNCLEMPSVALFPVGDYVIISQTMSNDNSKEFFRGQSTLKVATTSTAMGKIQCQLLADSFSDPIYPKVYGQVELMVNIDFDMSTFGAPSNSDAFVAPNKNDMIVEFYYMLPEGGSKLCKKYDKFEQMSQKISFPIGQYKIRVKSHETDTLPSICDYAYFSGQADMTVSEGFVSQGEIKCSMKNSRVALVFNNQFYNAFSTWDAQLRFKGDKSDAFVFSAPTPKIKYIEPKDIFIKMKAIQNGDNKEYTKLVEISGIKPSTNVEVQFNGCSEGSVNVGIDINVKINRKDHEVKFPDSDSELDGGGFNPGTDPKPDPEPEPDPVILPVIEGVGFNVDNIKEISTSRDFYADGKLKKPLKVTAKAEDGGLQTFLITIASPDIGDALLVPIFGGSSFDLANVPPGSILETNLSGLGILPLGTKVKGEKSFSFDLTAFMSMLPVNEITHNFTLKISDGKSNVVQKTIRIKRVK